VTVEAALPTTRPKPEPLTRDRDFVLLWFGRAVSDLGSAVSMVALPLVAVLVLDATTFQVTLVAAASALIGAAMALPLGGAVEYRPKRPVMILADLVRGAALASVPLPAADRAVAVRAGDGLALRGRPGRCAAGSRADRPLGCCAGDAARGSRPGTVDAAVHPRWWAADLVGAAAAYQRSCTSGAMSSA
jgi:hypothetical protein